MVLRFNLLPIYQALALLTIAQNCYAAANFQIQLNGSFPTTAPAGGSKDHLAYHLRFLKVKH